MKVAALSLLQGNVSEKARKAEEKLRKNAEIQV